MSDERNEIRWGLDGHLFNTPAPDPDNNSGFSDRLANMPGMKPGSWRVSGYTAERPEVTWAVADPGMPLGQQWVVRADDEVPALRGITGIPPTEFVVIMNPADPDWPGDRPEEDR